MNGEFQWPLPQTEGRQRDLNTVAADPNVGKIARPTQFEAQSLLTQVGSYVNNWLGDISTANRVKDAQSLIMAGKVSSAAPGSFSTLVDTGDRAPSPFDTMADWFLEEVGLKVSSVEPAAKVAGRPVAPETTNYQYANNIDKSIKDIASAGSAFAEQVKGFFNITYEGPVKPAAVPIEESKGLHLYDEPAAGTVLIILGILYLVTA